MRTTVGQLMVNEALPEDLRDYARRLDKKGLKALFRLIAERHPDQYREIAQRLMLMGRDVSHWEGSSISLKDLKRARVKDKYIPLLQAEIKRIAEDDRLSQTEKDRRIIESINQLVGRLDEAVLEEGLNEGNSLSVYASSGTRGNRSHVNQLRGAPLMVLNHRNEPIPVPVLNSYSEGLDPVELWATSYGVRKGYVDLKQSTPEAGYFGKQLANAAHRLVVSDRKPLAGTGLPVDTNDPDNEGSVLAADYPPYTAGTVLTPKILKQLHRLHKRILVHSPISAIAAGGGVPRLAAGYRERSGFSPAGDNIGIAAAQAVSEPLAQAAISSKHIAGIKGGGGKGATAEAQAGFDVLNRLANIPRTYEGKATVSELDGQVSQIEQAPQGGSYVYVGKERHYVPPGLEVAVKPGQKIEAGDVLSNGIPSPSDVVRHKGIGEGRRYFMQRFYRTLQDSGVPVHRRNIELISRALINHVRVTGSGMPGSLPDDVVEYDDLAAKYVPRKEAESLAPSRARGRYLEQPVLHYSIGTRISPSVERTLKEFGVGQVLAHAEPPNFVPEMQRAVDIMSRDQDWMVRLGGFQLKKHFLESLHRGGKSELAGTSYIPMLARGAQFGASE